MPKLKAVDPASAAADARELLDSVQEKFGATPNMVRTMANSPAVLMAYVNFEAALAKGSLPARLLEQIALTVAEANQCGYCLAAHTAIGKAVGLTEEAILDSRRGESPDSKEEAALQFARALVAERGWGRDQDVARLRQVGYSDAEIVEIIANVALNLFTNYFNQVAGTEIDFPQAHSVAGELRSTAP